MEERRWPIVFRRACRLTSASTTHQGESSVSVRANMVSLALEKSTHRLRDSRSIGLSFQCLLGSERRSWKRRPCSSSETENQYLRSLMFERISISSKSGVARRNSWYSSSVQKPITRSTPARLYQERSKSTISPADGNSAT